jgi:hypothetical protein
LFKGSPDTGPLLRAAQNRKDWEGEERGQPQNLREHNLGRTCYHICPILSVTQTDPARTREETIHEHQEAETTGDHLRSWLPQSLSSYIFHSPFSETLPWFSWTIYSPGFSASRDFLTLIHSIYYRLIFLKYIFH